MAPPVRPALCVAPHEPHPSAPDPVVPAEPCPSPHHEEGPPPVPVAPRHKLILFGDTQINVMPYQASAYRSLLVKNFVSSALRLLESNVSIFDEMKVLFDQAVPPEQRPFYRGPVAMGDEGDVASKEEMNSFFRVMDIMGESLRLIVSGNHEIYPEGVDQYGIIGMLLGWFLGLIGERNVREDIHGPEVGGIENILDKDSLIEIVDREMYGRSPDPIVVVSSDRHNYLLADGRTGSWHNTEEVFRRFWRQEANGNWTSELHYKDGQKRNPEQSKDFISSGEVGRTPTRNGTFSFNLIGVDTYDNTTEPGNSGALEGHEGYMQEARIYALMQQRKLQDPNALFFRLGHERSTGLATPQGLPLVGPYVRSIGYEESIERRINSDGALIFTAGAHHHDRGFTPDICAPDGGEWSREVHCSPDRKNPLPELTVPSVIDNGELVTLDIHVDPDNPDLLVFEIEFVGVDPSKIPGMTDAARQEYEQLKPRVNTFYSTLPFITDPRFRREAEKGPAKGEKLYYATSIRKGFLWDPEEPDALIIANDGIRSHAEQKKYLLRSELAKLKVDLIQVGLGAQAADLEASVMPVLLRLEKYYADIIKGHYTQLSGDHGGAHELIHLTDGVDEAVDRAKEALSQALARPSANPLHRKIMEFELHAVETLGKMVDGHKDWLVKYEGDLRSGRRPGEMRGNANQFADPAFRIYWGHLPERPYGSAGAALGLLLFDRAWKEDMKYVKGEQDGSMPDDFFRHDSPYRVPDRIRIEYDTRSRTERVVYKPLSDPEIRQKLGWWDGIQRPASHEAATNYGAQLAESLLRLWQTEGETQYSLGFSLGRGETLLGALGANPFAPRGGNRGISLQLGRRLILVDDWRGPRINLVPTAGVDFNWQARHIESLLGPELQETFSSEFPLRARLTIGDPWGWVEAGGFLSAGAVRGPGDHDASREWGLFTAAGLSGGILDGSVMVDAGRVDYTDRKDAWQVFLNFTDRFPDILWNGIGHKSPKLPKIPVPSKTKK